MSSRVLTCCSACSSVMSRCACTRRHMRDGAAAAALPPPPPLLSAASPRSPSAFEILASGVTSRRNACLGAGNSSFHLFPPRSCCGCQALSASAPQPHPRSARIYEAGGEGGGGAALRANLGHGVDQRPHAVAEGAHAIQECTALVLNAARERSGTIATGFRSMRVSRGRGRAAPADLPSACTVRCP